jgi:hypothetical protein
MLNTILQNILTWSWKIRYRPGKIITRFIAKDIRRDVAVIESAEIESGIITGKIRTWDVLYASKGIKEKPSFGDVQRFEIEHLWDWPGDPWLGSRLKQ